MKSIIALLLFVGAILVGHSEACHNSTGACHHDGRFECMDGAKIPWSERCDGKEDCKDGMDEFMCPRAAVGHHEVHEEASCGPTCSCQVSATTVASTSPYYTFSLYSPTWGLLMTGTPVNGLWGCNPTGTKTASVQMYWYKKGAWNSGTSVCVGNTRLRGFICCGRQYGCVCNTGAGARCS